MYLFIVVSVVCEYSGVYRNARQALYARTKHSTVFKFIFFSHVFIRVRLPAFLLIDKKMTGIELITMSAVVVCIVVAFCGYRDYKK